MSEIDWNLVDRYLSGNRTPDEIARVHQWVTRSPRSRLFLEGVREATASLSISPATIEKFQAEIWERLCRHVFGGAAAARHSAEPSRPEP